MNKCLSMYTWRPGHAAKVLVFLHVDEQKFVHKFTLRSEQNVLYEPFDRHSCRYWLQTWKEMLLAFKLLID